MEHIKVATVGNPGLHIPTLLGSLPGMSALVTSQMEKKMESVDMFALKREDFIDDIEGVVTVGEFYQMAAGGQIIFT